jgi:hypothetical protein
MSYVLWQKKTGNSILKNLYFTIVIVICKFLPKLFHKNGSIFSGLLPLFGKNANNKQNVSGNIGPNELNQEGFKLPM